MVYLRVKKKERDIDTGIFQKRTVFLLFFSANSEKCRKNIDFSIPKKV